MAEVYSVDNGGAALTAATAKTLLELATPSTQSNRLVEVSIGCDATAAGTLKIELIQATTGTGTAYTPKKFNGEAQNRVANTTAKINDTVEPTSVTVLRTWDFVLPFGGFAYQQPLGREHFQGPSLMYGYRFTASVGCNGFITVLFEE